MGTKSYEITFPDGGTERIVNLKKFCDKYGLDQGHMSGVASGRRSHHKGYLVKVLGADNTTDKKRREKEKKILDVCQKLVQTSLSDLSKDDKERFIITLFAIEKIFNV